MLIGSTNRRRRIDKMKDVREKKSLARAEDVDWKSSRSHRHSLRPRRNTEDQLPQLGRTVNLR
jgi:hypothetical protein